MSNNMVLPIHSDTKTACNGTRNLLSGLTPLFQSVTDKLYQKLKVKLMNETSLDDALGFYDDLMQRKSDQPKSQKDFIEASVKLGLKKDNVTIY